jgi:UPF0755 protein
VAAVFGYIAYQRVFAPNTPGHLENKILLIPTGSGFDDVIDSLKANHQLKNENTFRWAADKMDYHDETVRKGRYTIRPGASNRDLIAMLRGGNQTPLALTIQNVRTIDQLTGRVASRLEMDSLTLADFFSTQFDSLANTRAETRLTRFIPNTYEFYWTVTPEDFARRMLKEYERFWNDDRLAKAAALQMTPDEVYTLASIVEKETNYNPEKPVIAGVYLNRIAIGMPLQADPTIVFAVGDFEMKRVYHGHLEIDSPYNTYKNPGLPPGPIFMPGIPSIDAVLNREKHNYLYFCAKPADEGQGHAFAETYEAHLVNANRYQRWLTANGFQ